MKKWRYASGDRITCIEKIKVLEENYKEIELIIKDALDDAVLIGIEENEFKAICIELIKSLKSDY